MSVLFIFLAASKPALQSIMSRRPYGQIPVFANLPVKFGRLRIKVRPIMSVLFIFLAASKPALQSIMSRRPYGQIPVFANLPVKPASRLRANPRFCKSARKIRLTVTGKLRANPRFCKSARKIRLTVTGKTSIPVICPSPQKPDHRQARPFRSSFPHITRRCIKKPDDSQ